MPSFKKLKQEEVFSPTMLNSIRNNGGDYEIVTMDLFKKSTSTIEFVYQLIEEVYMNDDNAPNRHKINKRRRTDVKWMQLAYLIVYEDWKEGYDRIVEDRISLNQNSNSTRAMMLRRICEEKYFFTVEKSKNRQGTIDLVPTEMTLKIREFIKNKKNFVMTKRFLIVFEENDTQ
jgi:hypothetical protein